MNDDITMNVAQGDYRLRRSNNGGRSALRAWDAADELLLTHVSGLDLAPDATTVIVGDSYGALSIPLASLSPTVVVDRFSSRQAIASNAEANGVDAGRLHVVDALAALPARIDVALVRPARSLVMLEHQLRLLAPSLHPDSVVIASSMVKHLHTSTLEVFERVLGPTTTSLAQRRARLVHTVISSDHAPSDQAAGPWDWPQRTQIEPGDTVIDLGCGNGVLGLVAALDQPDASVTLVDDSSMAVSAARATLDANHARGNVVWGDGLTDWEPDDAAAAGSDRSGPAEDSVDLVLCNPPFHDGHALVDAIAWKMFSDARRTLAPGGEMWVVGNRHLGYHVKLRRLFGDVDVVSSDPKFVVLRSVCP